MLASSGEVDRFIQGLNNGTIRILPEANNIIVDDSKGNKQTLANRLADAVKEYEYRQAALQLHHIQLLLHFVKRL